MSGVDEVLRASADLEAIADELGKDRVDGMGELFKRYDLDEQALSEAGFGLAISAVHTFGADRMQLAAAIAGIYLSGLLGGLRIAETRGTPDA